MLCHISVVGYMMLQTCGCIDGVVDNVLYRCCCRSVLLDMWYICGCISTVVYKPLQMYGCISMIVSMCCCVSDKAYMLKYLVLYRSYCRYVVV